MIITNNTKFGQLIIRMVLKEYANEMCSIECDIIVSLYISKYLLFLLFLQDENVIVQLSLYTNRVLYFIQLPHYFLIRQ